MESETCYNMLACHAELEISLDGMYGVRCVWGVHMCVRLGVHMCVRLGVHMCVRMCVCVLGGMVLCLSDCQLLSDSLC